MGCPREDKTMSVDWGPSRKTEVHRGEQLHECELENGERHQSEP